MYNCLNFIDVNFKENGPTFYNKNEQNYANFYYIFYKNKYISNLQVGKLFSPVQHERQYVEENISNSFSRTTSYITIIKIGDSHLACSFVSDMEL